jgi:hypothetical protein
MPADWFRDAVFYEVFVRAYADSNGDGIGDLPGLTSGLDYLQNLGAWNLVDLVKAETIARTLYRPCRFALDRYGYRWLRVV